MTSEHDRDSDYDCCCDHVRDFDREQDQEWYEGRQCDLQRYKRAGHNGGRRRRSKHERKERWRLTLTSSRGSKLVMMRRWEERSKSQERRIKNEIDSIKENKKIAKFNFRAKNKWIAGTENQTTVGDFYGACKTHTRETPHVFVKDEPEILLGTDKGANPVEYLLAGLALF